MFRIRIDLEDSQLEAKYGKRLGELSGSLDIVLGKDLDTEDADLVIDRGNFSSFFPVSKGLIAISDRYSEKMGKPLYRPKNGFRKRYFFTSPVGGSGLSSIALVFARLVSGKTGEKVLLIDVGKDGSFIYAETGEMPSRTIDELRFRADTGQEIAMGDYLMSDHYGIDILTAEEISNELLDILMLKGNYDTVVTAGIPQTEGEDGMDISVINIKDSRMCDHKCEADIKVINREYINNVSEDRVLIKEDGLSFKNPFGKVMIAMDGDFSYGVEKLMRKAVKEYEYV